MDIKIQTIVLMLGILFTGLTAGLCFTWSNAVTPGLGRLDNLTFLKSFQSINRAIINRSFLFVFFGPVILLFLNAWFFRGANQISFLTFLIAALVFFVGIGLITIFGNVPLNEMIDKVNLDTLSSIEISDLRRRFEKPWNRWHLKRTIASSASFALLLIGLIYSKL
ncbi:anthrone oxygenase family protein [Spongiivirga sp. MCCC 1A20706]|uniref:anthrone oxygenase family protein n=1 Tax=Spongiivirga sp. MCCC 1A20706 TaxID=3160963 RepID=UPI0039779CFB